MRKITEIKAIFSKTELLSVNHIVNIKGGRASISDSTTTSTLTSCTTITLDPLAAVADDKRRPRPGGGASTQLIP